MLIVLETETSIKWDRHTNGKLFKQNIAMMFDTDKLYINQK